MVEKRMLNSSLNSEKDRKRAEIRASANVQSEMSAMGGKRSFDHPTTNENGGSMAAVISFGDSRGFVSSCASA